MQALIIYKGEHKLEETSSHKIPTQKMKFNSKQKPSDPSYESISDNKDSAEFQVRIENSLLSVLLSRFFFFKYF